MARPPELPAHPRHRQVLVGLWFLVVVLVALAWAHVVLLQSACMALDAATALQSAKALQTPCTSPRVLYALAGLATLLLCGLAWGMGRYVHRLRTEAHARNQSLLQAQARQQQLDAVLAISPDGFLAFDHNRCVQFVSPAFAYLSGLDTRAMEGLSEQDVSAMLAALCVPTCRFVGLAAMRQAAQGQQPAVQVLELQEAGNRVLQLQLCLSDSSTVSHMVQLRDITQATEADTRKSQFLATAAHELRTPMASIVGFSEVLMGQGLDAASQQEFLGIIHKQSRLMVDILNELLDLARIEARRGKDFQFERVCLQDLLADLTKAFQCPPGRAQPDVQVPDAPVYVHADTGKLRRALLNVLSNAYKYSPDGGAVRIVVERAADALGAAQVVVRISDHGMGMTPEQVHKVCKPFYRADTSGRVPGTGLGMAITKEIVEHHQGAIAILSAPGEGTQVSVHLPEETNARPAA